VYLMLNNNDRLPFYQRCNYSAICILIEKNLCKTVVVLQVKNKTSCRLHVSLS
jgi:hypothetical protein